LYELLEISEDANESLLDMIPTWELAVTLYEQKEFAKAGKIFHSIAQSNFTDRVARLYLARCVAYFKNPPPEEWNGVNNLTEK
jgi:adenylate cyclase